MVRYLISAHGRMASGMKETLDVLLGASGQVEIFDAYVDDSNVEEELKRRIEGVSKSDYLVMLSDISSGSVNQIMMRYMNREKTFLVTGISLALVLGLAAVPREAVTAREIEEVITQSREMMFLVKDPEDPEEGDDGFF